MASRSRWLSRILVDRNTVKATAESGPRIVGAEAMPSLRFIGGLPSRDGLGQPAIDETAEALQSATALLGGQPRPRIVQREFERWRPARGGAGSALRERMMH